MYRASGMTGPQRDAVIYQLRRKRYSYSKIARAVGVSVGTVQHSLRRTAQRLSPGAESADDWDADLR
jgi:DNA-directed RNA polymerase specialized sigma24 family protein